VNDKTLRVLIAFVIGIALGIALGALFAGIRKSGDSAELKRHLEQVNRDLDTAITAQREAADRASRLHAELGRVRDHARSLEEGTRRIETRTDSLADNLDGIAERSGELADGIQRASGSLEESRVLLEELGVIVRSLPSGLRTEDNNP